MGLGELMGSKNFLDLDASAEIDAAITQNNPDRLEALLIPEAKNYATLHSARLIMLAVTSEADRVFALLCAPKGFGCNINASMTDGEGRPTSAFLEALRGLSEPVVQAVLGLPTLSCSKDSFIRSAIAEEAENRPSLKAKILAALKPTIDAGFFPHYRAHAIPPKPASTNSPPFAHRKKFAPKASRVR